MAHGLLWIAVVQPSRRLVVAFVVLCSASPALAGKWGKQVTVIHLGDEAGPEVSSERGAAPTHGGIVVERRGFLEQLFGQRRAEAERRDSARARVDQAGVKQLLMTLKARDPETYEHSLRVAEDAAYVARRSGLSPREVEAAETGALLHDLGKVMKPEILALTKKQGPLTADERRLMDEHAELGAQAIEGTLRRGWFRREVAGVARGSHTGAEQSGPVTAKDAAQAADVLNALLEPRSYKKALRPAEAAAILRQEVAKGTVKAAAAQPLLERLEGKRR